MILLLRISFSISVNVGSAIVVSSLLARRVSLELQGVNLRHQRAQRPIDHLMALDERSTREIRARDVDREMIAAAGVVLGDDLGVREGCLQVALDQIRAHGVGELYYAPSGSQATGKRAPALAW